MRLKQGNRQAAVEFVDNYYKQIYLYFRRLGHSRQTSEDLTQESFFSAWQHIEQLRDNLALNSWLYRIAGNLSRQYLRRHKGKNAVSIEALEISKAGSETNSAENIEQLALLNKAVARLPLKLREVIVLHYMQHLTISEAARAAGLTEGTFKSRLNTALKRLRRQIKHE